MIIPYRMQISYVYAPVSNAIIIGVTCVAYFLTTFLIIPESISESMVLQDWSFNGLFGCIFLHGGLFHLIGNMLFLWVFGNAINSVVGNVWYTLVYLFLGLCASSTHLIFSDIPAIGASGAVNGIVGMTLVLFPVNKLESFFLFGFLAGKFFILSYMMIIIWFVFDIIGAVTGGGGIAYWAHVGGFVSGMAIATILLAYNRIAIYDRTLFDIITGHGREEKPRGYLSPQSDYYEDKVLETAKAVKADEFPGNEALVYDPFTDSYIPTRQVEIPPAPPIARPLTDPGPKPTAIPSVAPYPIPSIAGVPSPSDLSNPVAPREAQPLPVLSFRLLRVLRDNNQCTCFFVNEGDELVNVSIEHPEAVNTEIYPNKILKKKEPGWIKLNFQEGNVPQQLSLILTCRGGSGGTFQARLTIEEETKKIVQE